MNAQALRQFFNLAWYGLTVGLIQEGFYTVDTEYFEDKFSDREILDWANKIFSGQLHLSYMVNDMKMATPCLRS